jgi:hypothetical protein
MVDVLSRISTINCFGTKGITGVYVQVNPGWLDGFRDASLIRGWNAKIPSC